MNLSTTTRVWSLIFDFRGMADILGTHIGFLEADFEAKVYTCAGEFGDEPLQCCLEMRCEGSIVSVEQVTHKCSFDFGFGAEASHRRASMELHSVKNQRRRTEGERRRFQKSDGDKRQLCFTPLDLK